MKTETFKVYWCEGCDIALYGKRLTKCRKCKAPVHETGFIENVVSR